MKSASKPWILVLLAAIALALGAFWWLHGGREQLMLTLRRLNRTYVLDCAKTCADFIMGKNYPMLDRGGILEFHTNGDTLRLPVLQVHVDFDTVTGVRG